MATGRTSKDGAWSGPCSLIVVTPTQGQAKSCFCEPAGAEPVVPATTRTPSTDAQYGARPRTWKPSLVTTPPGRYSSRASASGCGEIGIHAGFRCLWALRPWRFESSQPHFSVSPALERGFVVLVDLAGLRPAGRLPAALQRRALVQRFRLLDACGPLRPALAV